MPDTKSGITKSSSSSSGLTLPKFGTSICCSKHDVILTKPQFPKSYRESASADEQLKISKATCTGSKVKLQKINDTKLSKESNTFSDDQFNNIVEMHLFLSEMKQHFTKYDCVHFFCNFPALNCSKTGGPDNESHCWRNQDTVDLFQQWTQIGVKKDYLIDHIAEAVGWLQLYTTEESKMFLEDLEWTRKYLMDSISLELAASVQTCLDEDYEEHMVDGPLTFAIMVEQAVNLSGDSIIHIQNSF